MNKIPVLRGVTNKLVDIFGCDISHVRNCLNGFVESDLADQIRQKAKDWGYKEVRATPMHKIKVNK